ncbi:MAG: peptidase T [Alistipes sp.]|jgi:tripeptide aminopeptidase|nr:peptidase T [Alistipes sp.]
MSILERFLRYVSFDTQSDPASDTYPSTPGQIALLSALADELRALGAADVAMDSNGYVTATIPATPGCENEPTIGFLAHVDTSPDAPGANVKPRLLDKNGDTIITTDGSTLLGADDKAGVAEIMTATEILLSGTDPQLKHGRVRIAFTPDEEIGRGVDRFDVAAFGADFAYTMDGGEEGELEFENFNAAGALVTIRGRNTHPGDAKGKMLNALRIAGEFDAAIPPDERPETTAGYEGFFHLMHIEGGVAAATLDYIIRDHDREKFAARKDFLIQLAAHINKTYGPGTATVTLTDQYLNMREVMEKHPGVVERAKRAMIAAGVTPRVKPIRGGTDGARLSYMGLPCPNIFAGGVDFHSLDESVSLRAMESAVKVIIEIVKLEK